MRRRNRAVRGGALWSDSARVGDDRHHDRGQDVPYGETNTQTSQLGGPRICQLMRPGEHDERSREKHGERGALAT